MEKILNEIAQFCGLEEQSIEKVNTQTLQVKEKDYDIYICKNNKTTCPFAHFHLISADDQNHHHMIRIQDVFGLGEGMRNWINSRSGDIGEKKLHVLIKLWNAKNPTDLVRMPDKQNYLRMLQDLNNAVTERNFEILERTINELSWNKLKLVKINAEDLDVSAKSADKELMQLMEQKQKIKIKKDQLILKQNYNEAAMAREEERQIEKGMSKIMSKNLFKNDFVFNALNEFEVIYFIPEDAQVSELINKALRIHFDKEGYPME